MTDAAHSEVTFTLGRAAAGYCEWRRKTVCEHGALQAAVYTVSWPILEEFAAEAFAQHQAVFGCACTLTMGTTELPPEPVVEITPWPGYQGFRAVDEPTVVR